MRETERILAHRGFQLVSADSVSQVLRDLRVRNTASPTSREIATLGERLAADALLLGTIHRFEADSNFSEASMCARLVRTADAAVLWNRCATSTGGGSGALFSTPAHGKERLALGTTRKLLAALKPRVTEKRKVAREIVLPTNGGRRVVTCTRVAIIPPQDESEAQYASTLVSDILSAELFARGVTVIDAGSVRNQQLAAEDLRYGQSVTALSSALADSLGADLVVTGAISVFTESRLAQLGGGSEVALELRLIDPQNNVLLWAASLERGGAVQHGLFGLGEVSSPARIAHDLLHDFVSTLRLRRVTIN